MERRLALKKVTIRNLDEPTLRGVVGGDDTDSCFGTCDYSCAGTCDETCAGQGTCDGTVCAYFTCGCEWTHTCVTCPTG